jgi:hypothetical protein
VEEIDNHLVELIGSPVRAIRDRLTGKPVDAGGRLTLAPYRAVWLTQESG